jgi:hypothetical protein
MNADMLNGAGWHKRDVRRGFHNGIRRGNVHDKSLSSVRRCVRDQIWFTPYLLGYLTAAKHPGAQSAPAVEGSRDDRVRIS